MTQWMHIVVKIEICTEINIDKIKSAKNSNKQMEYILPLNNIKWLVIYDFLGLHVTHWMLCQADEINF